MKKIISALAVILTMSACSTTEFPYIDTSSLDECKAPTKVKEDLPGLEKGKVTQREVSDAYMKAKVEHKTCYDGIQVFEHYLNALKGK